MLRGSIVVLHNALNGQPKIQESCFIPAGPLHTQPDTQQVRFAKSSVSTIAPERNQMSSYWLLICVPVGVTKNVSRYLIICEVEAIISITSITQIFIFFVSLVE